MNGHVPDEASGLAVHFPELAHIRERHDSMYQDDTDSDTDTDDELEATELRRLRVSVESTLPRMSHVLTDGKALTHWHDSVRRFWRHNVRISVPHDDCRDHLANERTFLGYLRNSISLSIVGITIAQLYRLEHSPDPSKVYGYFTLSKPLSAIFHIAALGMSLLGAHRFMRQQKAMSIGRVHAGGWEIIVTGSGFFLLLVMMLAALIGVDIYQSLHPKPDWAS